MRDATLLKVKKRLEVDFFFDGETRKSIVQEGTWAPLTRNPSPFYYVSGGQYSPIHDLWMLSKEHSRSALESAIISAGVSIFGHNYPRFLAPRCGKGIQVWQYPCQMAPYLLKISQHRPRSYLEIGTLHGGTFAFTVEYLHKISGQAPTAMAVDMILSPFLDSYTSLSPKTEFVLGNSHEAGIKHKIKENGPYDLVMIDGDHTAWGCFDDLETCMPLAKMIAVHDICDSYAYEVRHAWEEFKRRWSGIWDFFEFVDQYPDLDNPWMGIGLAIRKNIS